MLVVYVILGIVVLVGIAVAISYNRFVSQRNLIRDSWSNIDTELRRRHDLIPNLVETVEGYAVHEREVLAEVTEARTVAVDSMDGGGRGGSSDPPGKQAGAENALVGSLRHLLAVAESYPDLKADGAFLSLQDELTNTEDRIQAARRFYNANVRDYRNQTRQVPGVFFAHRFGMREIAFFECDTPAVRQAPQAVFAASPAMEA